MRQLCVLRKSKASLWFAGVILALSVAVPVALAADYTTYYCGNATSYCTLGTTAKSTNGVAKRYNNNIHCKYSICHTQVFYYSDGTGKFGVVHTNGGQNASYGASGPYYVYSRCKTDSGYGTNTARCWTDWYT